MFALALCLGTPIVVAAADTDEDKFKDVRIESAAIADGIYVLTGRGGNIGVSVGGDGVFLIDDQYAPLTPRIKEALAAISGRPVRFVINTHWHGDHTGGNENLAREGTVVVAHDHVYERMGRENFIALFNEKVPPSPKGALPVISFNDTITFHLNGHDIHAVHVKNAHTDGDSVVHIRGANVIHAGDVWFNGMYPYIDFDSGGSLAGMIAAVDVILGMADGKTRIIPGHGPVSDRDGLAAYRKFLVDVQDRVGGLLRQGKTLEEIVAAKPLADYEPALGKGFLSTDKFLEIAVATLRDPPPP
ncbi:MAG: MBL fold metallo-hydrolase [Gammaproteobacteria bacterium]|nr:MBL fold metallo-hydrolase [Gammaproteobacteria bacterium]